MPISENEARLREELAAHQRAVESLLVENSQLREERDAYKLKSMMVALDVAAYRQVRVVDAVSVERP